MSNNTVIAVALRDIASDGIIIAVSGKVDTITAVSLRGTARDDIVRASIE